MIACVLDTDVVIAALDRSDAHHQAATEMISELVLAEVGLLLSLINYAETLVRPAENDATLRVAVRAIGAIGITLFPPTAAIARDAARLRGLNVSLADGFALATASCLCSQSRDLRPAGAAGARCRRPGAARVRSSTNRADPYDDRRTTVKEMAFGLDALFAESVAVRVAR